MGTSASSTGPNNQSLLIPPWAEQGGLVQIRPDNDEDIDPESGGAETVIDPYREIDNTKVQELISGTIENSAQPNRLVSARSSFGEYAKGGGTSSELRSSLRKYAKGSGGGSGTARRLASGITAGTGLLRMMRGDSVTVNSNTLSLSGLSGLTTDQAIDRITEHLTPENGDADAVRIALDYALAESLPDDVDFDAGAITNDIIHETLSCYLTDLIFQDIVTGMGTAWFRAEHASKHHRMEEDLRELVKVVTREQVEKLTHGKEENITKDNITQLQIDTITQTVEVWESYDD